MRDRVHRHQGFNWLKARRRAALLSAVSMLALAAGPVAFAQAQGFLGSIFGQFLLFGWTVALFYHFCNGIRHLAWDLGYGYDIETVTRSGWFTVGATAGLTLFAWILGYALLG